MRCRSRSDPDPEPDLTQWIARWIGDGLRAVEALIGDDGYCSGTEPGLADVYLVPALSAARQFSVPLERPALAQADV
jgi:glutathione S-transferase